MQIVAFQMASGGSSGGSGCSEVNEGYDSHDQGKTYHRHTVHQIQRLEGFYRDCPHPDENQRRQLGIELGLQPRQIKFWFQNKRTQSKAQNERAANTLLRLANARLRSENTALRETLKSFVCVPCGGQHIGVEERSRINQELQQENRELKHEYEKMSTILARYMGIPLRGARFDLADATPANQGSGSTVFEDDSLIGSNNADSLGLVDQMKPNPELEKLLMTEIAETALCELLRLFTFDQPLWIKSPSDDQSVIDYHFYGKIFSGLSFKYSKSRMESSKYSGVVAADARWLVNLYLDADKWVDLFPTVYSKARAVRLLEAGSLENRCGSLQLIYEQMQLLSPLTRPREFRLLRYCKQIEAGIWVILDVSYDCFSGTSLVSPTSCWKHPSGVTIKEIRNGLSKVTSIEHVEVDDNFQIHPIYEDLFKNALGFGAKRRITTLQRACERYSYFIEAGRSGCESAEGRRSMIMLACRMVKSYCSIFSLFGAAGFHQSPEPNNRVQIAVRKNTCADQPVGIVISAASSFWIPASPVRVFNYLNDHILRSQWDVLCNGSPVCEIMQILTGSQPSNVVSILQPLNPGENLMIFQETMVDKMGSIIVYAPVDTSSMLEVATGTGSSSVPILASGFAIMADGPDKIAAPSTSTSNSSSGGSLVTAAFQILASSSLSLQDVSMNLVSTAEAFVTRAVHVIKSAFDFSD